MERNELLFDDYINELIEKAEHQYDVMIDELDVQLKYWEKEYEEVCN